MNLHHYIDKFCRIITNGRTQAHFGRIKEVYDNVIIFEATNGDRFWLDPLKIDDVVTADDAGCLSATRPILTVGGA